MRVDDMAVVLPPNLLKLLEVYNASRPVLLGSKLVLPGTSNVYFTGGQMRRALPIGSLDSAC